ncbi:high affinity immunoglobulin epsilon receptor subunit gamma-like isoform X1 [Solea solea]|uniref:high affinity immunoglobulin epsilon receptor subunit gamma-like isoform X1 n=2 Tax=Solea solea TaxID=90069 RepID=UPI00272B966A|nr:high affinity immunoglobulin epsilon receptor subunit gamma-like isoform X1 [Solea solea]
MDKLMTCVFALSLLLAPVSCLGSVKQLFSEPVVCYVLDGILMVYCVVATALFFREKLSCAESQSVEEDCNIYQDLGTKEPDPYQVLEPTKTKKKPKKKKKPESAKVETVIDQYETLAPTT